MTYPRSATLRVSSYDTAIRRDVFEFEFVFESRTARCSIILLSATRRARRYRMKCSLQIGMPPNRESQDGCP
jgi:hypothetical protein